MILAIAVPTQRLAAGALEVLAGGVHEHQVEPREQVAPTREQPLLHHVLHAARGKTACGQPAPFPAAPRPA